MFNAFIKVIKGKDNLPVVEKGLKSLAGMDVLVGIPQEDSSRGDVAYNATHKKKIEEGSISRGENSITNAELLYIHTHGVRKRAMIAEMDAQMDDGKTYSEAYKMYIQAHGSPLWHAPPRPIIEPAIEDPENLEFITEDLKLAAQAALDGDQNQAINELEKAGMDAQNVVRDWFTNPKNNWPPNSPLTVRLKGSDRPLIDTGELRKSITYVIRRKRG